MVFSFPSPHTLKTHPLAEEAGSKPRPSLEAGITSSHWDGL